MMGVLKLLSALLLLSLLPPGISHVVKKFDEPNCIKFFLDKKTPDIPGILVDGNVQDQNRYKLICQSFNNIYRFATVYDIKKKIPVLSASYFTGTDGTSIQRPPWKIEPQLEDDKNIEKNMINSKEETYTNQAANKEYDGHENTIHRGHLFPFCYGRDADIKTSTNTLTNAVPQAASFNKIQWRTMEGRVKKRLEDECKDNNNAIKAHLLTGAVPSNPEVKMKGSSVNIPSFMWTAFCCYSSKQNKWIAEAHWGENKKDGQTQKLTLEGLEKHILFYPNGKKADAKLFPDKCPRNWMSNDSEEASRKRKADMSRGSVIKKRKRVNDDEDEYLCDYR